MPLGKRPSCHFFPQKTGSAVASSDSRGSAMATLWIHGGFPVVRVLSELTFGYLFYNFFERKAWFFSGFSPGIQGVPVGFPSNPKMGLGHSCTESRENISGL